MQVPKQLPAHTTPALTWQVRPAAHCGQLVASSQKPEAQLPPSRVVPRVMGDQVEGSEPGTEGATTVPVVGPKPTA